jgi:hypothetical protein
MEGRPWQECPPRGQPITKNQIAQTCCGSLECDRRRSIPVFLWATGRTKPPKVISASGSMMPSIVISSRAMAWQGCTRSRIWPDQLFLLNFRSTYPGSDRQNGRPIRTCTARPSRNGARPPSGAGNSPSSPRRGPGAKYRPTYANGQNAARRAAVRGSRTPDWSPPRWFCRTRLTTTLTTNTVDGPPN